MLEHVLACAVHGRAGPSNSVQLDRAALRSLRAGARYGLDAAAAAAGVAEAVALACDGAAEVVTVTLDALHAAVASAMVERRAPPRPASGGTEDESQRPEGGESEGRVHERCTAMLESCKMAEARCGGQPTGEGARQACSDAQSVGVSTEAPRRLSASCLLL